MPRYLVERGFHRGWDAGDDIEEYCRQILEQNYDSDVTWLHSYVSDDRKRLLCIYEAPSPEAIRKTAARNQLPVDRITNVQVLDPYSYRSRPGLPAMRGNPGF
jgi:hypothetical protein